MFWDKDLSILQNIVVNFKLKKALKEVKQGKTREWKEVFKELEKNEKNCT